MIKETTKADNKAHHAKLDAKAKGLTVDPTKSKFNTASRSGSITANSKLCIDLEIADKYTDEFRGQTAQIFDLAEQNSSDGILNFKEANEYWIATYVDTGIHKQDLVTVALHYKGVFNSPKGYKQIPKEELKKLITIR